MYLECKCSLEVHMDIDMFMYTHNTVVQYPRYIYMRDKN